jgi:6-phosphofructokinase 1
VRLAVQGVSGKMIAFERAPGAAYECWYVSVPLLKVNEGKQRLPDHFLNAAGNFVTEAFLEYLRPLVGPLPTYARLDDAADGEDEE